MFSTPITIENQAHNKGPEESLKKKDPSALIMLYVFLAIIGSVRCATLQHLDTLSPAEDTQTLSLIVGAFGGKTDGRFVHEGTIEHFSVNTYVFCRLPGTSCGITLELTQTSTESSIQLSINDFKITEDLFHAWLSLSSDVFSISNSTSDPLKDLFSLRDWDLLLHYSPKSESFELELSRERMIMVMDSITLIRVIPTLTQNTNHGAGVRLSVEIERNADLSIQHLKLFYGSEYSNPGALYIDVSGDKISKLPMTHHGSLMILSIPNFQQYLEADGMFGLFYSDEVCSLHLAEFRFKLIKEESPTTPTLSRKKRNRRPRNGAQLTSTSAPSRVFYVSVVCDGRIILSGDGPLANPEPLTTQHFEKIKTSVFVEGLTISDHRFMAGAQVYDDKLTLVIGGIPIRGRRCDYSLSSRFIISEFGSITLQDQQSNRKTFLHICGHKKDQIQFQVAYVPLVDALLVQPTLISKNGGTLTKMPIFFCRETAKATYRDFSLTFQDVDGTRQITSLVSQTLLA